MIGEDELSSDSLAVKKHLAWIGKLDKKYNKDQRKGKKKKTKKDKNVQDPGKKKNDPFHLNFLNKSD